MRLLLAAHPKKHPQRAPRKQFGKCPVLVPKGRVRSNSANAVNFHERGRSSFREVEAKGSIPTGTAKGVMPPRARSLMSQLNGVRHRGPNPAIVAGTSRLGSRNSEALNGTQMSRRR
jgi:hypothetical protein